MTPRSSTAEAPPDLPGGGSLRWSARVVDGSGATVWDHDPDRVLPTASVGKLLLLLHTADLLVRGVRSPAEPLSRTDVEPIGDSGLWQDLLADTLPLADAAALVGAHSDNLATNVLLGAVGLPAVDGLRVRLGLSDTRLLDRVRAARVPGTDPPYLSVGSGAELAGLAHRIACGTAVSEPADAMVAGWLGAGTDLSMVASAFGLDPLAHRVADDVRVDGRPARLWNKTGTDRGVRADVGYVVLGAPGREGTASYAYAVCAAWDAESEDRSAEVLAAMSRVGAWLRAKPLSPSSRPPSTPPGCGPPPEAPAPPRSG